MKLSRLISKLQEIYNKYGDMQVYAFGNKFKDASVFKQGLDELFVDLSKE